MSKENWLGPVHAQLSSQVQGAPVAYGRQEVNAAIAVIVVILFVIVIKLVIIVIILASCSAA
jgi:hypothetical protein